MSLSLVMVGPATAQAGEVWVDDNAPNDPSPGDPAVSDPLEDGSVDHPFDEIQEGIDAVESPGTVNVLIGTYNELITLKDGVEVLGAGQEVTIINGGGSGTVVTSTGVGPATKLDGFTITGGSTDYGAGMYNFNASPVVSNCTFSGNTATGGGGGMDNNISSSPTLTNCTFSGNSASSGGGMFNRNSSSPTLTSCTFSGNSATSCGGAMENYSLASPTLTNCTFFNNSASSGGVMYSYNSSPTLTNCTFSGNSATSSGGAMYNEQSSMVTVTNCTFSGSTASLYGGGMYNVESSPTVTNCTFSGNLAAWGGGMANNYSSGTVTNCTFYGNSASSRGGGMANLSSSPTVTNCILWGDIAPNDSEEFHSAPTPVLTYCDVQGGYTGTGNIDSDPLFADADGADNIVGTLDDDLHLTFGSPCIDAGNNSAPAIPATDFEGQPRIVDGDGDATATVDMGVDELLPCVSLDFPYDTVDEGAQFSIQVVVDHVVNFDSADYELHFDAAVIQLDSIGDGDIVSTVIPVAGYIELSAGNWSIVNNVGSAPGVTGGGYFAVLNFTAIGTDGMSTTIYLDNGTVSNNAATEIICNWTGATDSVTVDLLEVTAISVVGEPVATSEGYVVPHLIDGCTTETNFTMTPTVSGGTGAATYTYAWTFDTGGSGNTTASAPSDVTYGSSGAKTVDLRVTDALSSTSEGHEVSGSARVWDTLVADFSGDTGTTGYPQAGVVKWDTTQWVSTVNYPSTVDFTNSVTGGKTDAAYTCSWDFNNDATQDSTDANPAAFDFATFPGTVSGFTGSYYTVRLTANDALTASDDNTKTAYIKICVAGDVNEDFAVDALDIVAIEKIVAGINSETFTSDVNDDGNVNAIDITATELAAL